jgi:hypothetical protein
MGSSHSSATVKRARELYEAGWRCGQIPDLLAKEQGVKPSEVTIRRWVDQDYAEAQRQRRPIGALHFRRQGWKPRLERIRDLASLGISAAAVAKVASHDFGLSLNDRHVRGILEDKIPERSLRLLLYPKGAGR